MVLSILLCTITYNIPTETSTYPTRISLDWDNFPWSSLFLLPICNYHTILFFPKILLKIHPTSFTAQNTLNSVNLASQHFQWILSTRNIWKHTAPGHRYNKATVNPKRLALLQKTSLILISHGGSYLMSFKPLELVESERWLCWKHRSVVGVWLGNEHRAIWMTPEGRTCVLFLCIKRKDLREKWFCSFQVWHFHVLKVFSRIKFPHLMRTDWSLGVLKVKVSICLYIWWYFNWEKVIHTI